MIPHKRTELGGTPEATASPRFVLVLAIALLSVAACGPSGASPTAAGPSVSPSPEASLATIGQPADDGARIVGVQALGARMRDLTIESPSVGTVMVRLLLPSTFADRPAARFPVLYLLHGGGGEYADWTEDTDVEALTAPTDLLVVMPDALTSGFGDRSGVAAGATGMWETFHLTELRQLIERNWQAGEDRAIAGLSMGGFGTLTYAERHPDLFKGVASFSGGPLNKVALALMIEKGLAQWGDLNPDAANWDMYDPAKLIDRLKGKALYFSYGNGTPGPLDPPERTDIDELEKTVGVGNDAFVAALKEAGIPATVNAYGPGTHSWPYWERELHASLPLLLQAVGATSSSP
jgi:diacylglycerol O-acyltransferase / trehalose O-mycolyltransferase